MNNIFRTCRLKFITLVCLLLLTAAAIAQTEGNSSLDAINARGILRVGTTGDYPPFSFRFGKSKDFAGLDIELAEGLAHGMGVKLQFVPTTWPTLMQDFGDNKFDIALGGVSVTPERQKQGLFSMTYLHDGKTPITRCEDQARFQTLEQIDQSGVRLVTNPGGTNEKFARTQVSHAQLTVYPDNVTVFDQLVNGQADVMITDAIEARLQQHLHPQLCALHPDAPFTSSEKAILLPRDMVLKFFVDQWLQQMQKSGTLKKSLDHWLDFPWGLEQLRIAIDARLLLAPGVARAKWNAGTPIEDLQREEQVIRSAVQQGSALGLSEQWIRVVFGAQIAASKTVQRDLFAQWTEQHAGKFDDAPDLAKTIRPELDRLTTQLLHAMAANQAVLKDTARKGDVARAMRTLDAANLSKAAAEQALAPFVVLH